MSRASTWLLGALLLGGCEDPLKEAQRLESPRVLGVRVATESGPASLAAGQAAAFELLVAGPEGPVDGRLAFRVCGAAATDRGVPFCEGEPFAEATAALVGGATAFDVAADVAADARVALLGVACLGGEPELSIEPADWRCSSDEPPLRFSFDARVESPTFSNQNPQLSALTVVVGGVEVPLDDAQAAPSCIGSTPSLAAGATHSVSIVLGEGAREAREALQISHFSTIGSFERHYSFVAPQEVASTSLDWVAPSSSVPVKQYLVVRDGRGGVSWASWSFCTR